MEKLGPYSALPLLLLLCLIQGKPHWVHIWWNDANVMSCCFSAWLKKKNQQLMQLAGQGFPLTFSSSWPPCSWAPVPSILASEYLANQLASSPALTHDGYSFSRSPVLSSLITTLLETLGHSLDPNLPATCHLSPSESWALPHEPGLQGHVVPCPSPFPLQFPDLHPFALPALPQVAALSFPNLLLRKLWLKLFSLFSRPHPMLSYSSAVETTRPWMHGSCVSLSLV